MQPFPKMRKLNSEFEVSGFSSSLRRQSTRATRQEESLSSAAGFLPLVPVVVGTVVCPVGKIIHHRVRLQERPRGAVGMSKKRAKLVHGPRHLRAWGLESRIQGLEFGLVLP